MQEVVRRCDMPMKRKGGGTGPCGERVPGDTPQTFALDGTQYEGDFCEKHQGELRNCLAPYIEVARENRSRTAQNVRASLKGRGKGTFTTKDVRKWLEEQGREVAPSGRLPNELIEEFRAAHVA